MNENQNVNTKPAENEGEIKQENPTKRKLRFQSPVTIVHVPKKEKKQKTSAKEPAAEKEPKEKGEKLKKIKRIITGIGLVGGAALVGIGSYLKGRDDGNIMALCDRPDLYTMELPEEEPAPDPAGVSETSESSDD